MIQFKCTSMIIHKEEEEEVKESGRGGFDIVAGVIIYMDVEGLKLYFIQLFSDGMGI